MKLEFSAVIFAAWAVSMPAFAHEDHGGWHILARVEAAQATGMVVQMQLSVSNSADYEVTLNKVDVAGAQVYADLPQTIAAKGHLVFPMSLQFDAVVPGIFSAVLDFGSEGTGPVLVTPDIQ